MTAVSPVERSSCPSATQAPPKVAEVVDLAVEDDHVPGHRVHHGLGAGRREVEDRETAVGEQRAPAARVRRGDPRPACVRAAVDHRVAHSLQRGAVEVVKSPDDPGDATHRLGPLKKSNVVSATTFVIKRFYRPAQRVRNPLRFRFHTVCKTYIERLKRYLERYLGDQFAHENSVGPARDRFSETGRKPLQAAALKRRGRERWSPSPEITLGRYASVK